MSQHLAKTGEHAAPWVERRASSLSARQHAIPLLVCGDQPLFRAALSSLVERAGRFRIAAESTNDPGEVRQALQDHDVQMVLIDYDVAPDSNRDVEWLEKLLDSVAPRPALVVSSGLDDAVYLRAIRHGVSGIVFKASGADVLLAAIDSAQRGQVWLDRALLPQMFDDSHTRRMPCGEKSKIDQLTPREREIMLVACTGVTNKQIGNKLSISEATVRHHLGSIFAKLGVSTRSELVVFAYRHNIATSVVGRLP